MATREQQIINLSRYLKEYEYGIRSYRDEDHLRICAIEVSFDMSHLLNTQETTTFLPELQLFHLLFEMFNEEIDLMIVTMAECTTFDGISKNLLYMYYAGTSENESRLFRIRCAADFIVIMSDRVSVYDTEVCLSQRIDTHIMHSGLDVVNVQCGPKFLRKCPTAAVLGRSLIHNGKLQDYLKDYEFTCLTVKHNSQIFSRNINGNLDDHTRIIPRDISEPAEYEIVKMPKKWVYFFCFDEKGPDLICTLETNVHRSSRISPEDVDYFRRFSINPLGDRERKIILHNILMNSHGDIYKEALEFEEKTQNLHQI